MATSTRRAPLPGLTALRFFAATYVLLAHVDPWQRLPFAQVPLGFRLLSAGVTGVSCFFILSGFILAYTHQHVPHPLRFFRARFARVYPLYVFALLLSLPSFLRFLQTQAHAAGLLWAIPLDLLLLQDWVPAYAHSINSPAWTLSCEAFFYLIFPFLIGRVHRHLRHPVLWIALCWLYQLLPPLVNAYWLAPRSAGASALLSNLLTMPIGHLGEFLAGMVLGIAFLQRPEQAPQALHGAAPLLDRWLPVLSLAVCVLFLACVGFVPEEVLVNGLMLGPFCLLIWSLAARPSRFLASRPLQLGGEISFGVYVLQYPFAHLGLLVSHLFHIAFVPTRWMFGVYPAAWLTYLMVEKPCRALLLGRAPARMDKPIPTPQLQLS